MMPQNGSRVPQVSVVMPVYNAERFLRQAVDSILDQSFDNFELLALNDGSTDASLDILESYKDPRLRIISNERNIGIVETLNRGIREARAEYIARMDADDISHPLRLEKQVRFLAKKPKVAIVGTWINLINTNGKIFHRLMPPVESEEINKQLLLRNCIAHPTVMARRECIIIVGGYRPVRYGQDYDLWLRLSERFPLSNIPEVLLDYRIHEDQVSIKRLKDHVQSRRKTLKMALDRRREMGELMESTGVTDLSNWQRLAETVNSVGYEYLEWAYLYRLMRNSKRVRELAVAALVHSPFSRKIQKTAFQYLIETIFNRDQLNAMRWYKHRLISLIWRNKLS